MVEVDLVIEEREADVAQVLEGHGLRCTYLGGARRPSGITDAWHGYLQQSLGTLFCQILSLDRSF